MTNSIVDIAKQRYTTKKYDPAKKISASDIEKIKELLRFSPSSVNSQPWHFIIASTDEGKKRMSKATEPDFAFNTPSVMDGSLVIAFCSKLDVDDAYIMKILDQEEADGRFGQVEGMKESQLERRKFFVNLHREQLNDLDHWIGKQVYLNLGQFLLGVAALGIHATPMEGINAKALDEELGLAQKGLTTQFLVVLGYSDAEDFNAKLQKSRLPETDILTEI